MKIFPHLIRQIKIRKKDELINFLKFKIKKIQDYLNTQ